jgi:hypothetical protein
VNFLVHEKHERRKDVMANELSELKRIGKVPDSLQFESFVGPSVSGLFVSFVSFVYFVDERSAQLSPPA